MAIVTVALPVYNAMPYLPEAVESILHQTFSDFNFIIINDGSTDGSPEYLDSIKDSRVTVIHQKNRGLGATLNRSLDLCDTEYYARMDADDVSLSGRLETQYRFLETRKDVVVLGTQIAFIIGEKLFRAPLIPVCHRHIEKLLIRGKPSLCHSSIMIRTNIAKEIGGYRIKGAGEDFDFFLRMGEAGKLANLSQVLHRYRMHLGSIVTTRYYENRFGIDYAIECARRRRKGSPEPTLDAFQKCWENRGIFCKMGETINAWSGIQYRKGLLDFGNERKFHGTLRVASAAACRPFSAIRHVIRETWHK